MKDINLIHVDSFPVLSLFSLETLRQYILFSDCNLHLVLNKDLFKW